MSVDSRCIVKHKERNPVDAAVIRLFVAASEFVANQVTIGFHLFYVHVFMYLSIIFYLRYLSLSVYLTNITLSYIC